MKIQNIEDCLFLEIDTLIYNDPRNWLNKLSENKLSYLYDNKDRASSCIMYIKNHSSIYHVTDFFLEYVNNGKNEDWLSDMVGLSKYRDIYPDNVEILPSFYNSDRVPEITSLNYSKYNSIFDALNIGIFLFGLDPYHTNWRIVKGLHAPSGIINYTNETFSWKTDEKNRKIPYIWDSKEWIRINNLHIHSKNLLDALSDAN